MEIKNEDLLNKESKNEQAYNVIKKSIISNELKPNTMLVERQLSELLKISRTPIRHALMRLVNEGFVEFIANKGLFVSEINLADVMEIYSIRAVIEPFIISLCLQNSNPETYTKMKAAVENQEKAFEENNYLEYIKNDLLFHKIYVADCNNKRLQVFMNSMSDQLEQLANTTFGDSERAKDSIKQHKKILEAYSEKDIEKLKKLIEEHMEDIKVYYTNKFLLNGRFVS